MDLEHKPDLVIIDYVDYLKAPSRGKYSERKDEIDDSFIAANGLAKHLTNPSLTPSQVNRMGARDSIIEGDKAAGSYDKMMVADICISLSRMKEDKVLGTGRFHIMKNRYGQDGMTYNIKMTVNGKEVKGEVEGRTLLVQFLREDLGLTGTHVGCDTSQCGACTVHVNGRAMKSCSLLATHLDGSEITTIEGLAEGEKLHPMQEAFREYHALQCGFCTPGMVMSAIGIVDRHKGEELDEKTVRHELEGNICRCTGYHNIVKAVLAASEVMNK